MAKGISGKTSFIKRRMPAEIFGSGPPLIAAAIGAVSLFAKPETHDLGYIAAGSSLWLLAASGYKIFQARTHDNEALGNEYDGLTAALMVLHATVAHICNVANDRRDQHLRVTFHRVVPPIDKPIKIEQLVNYVGGKGNGAARQFPVHCGLTGLSVRERSPAVCSLVNDDTEARKRELIKDWGYTEEDLKSLSLDRPSSMAVPILASNGHDALGVVYLDSDRRDLFASKDVQEAIITACSGIRTYINRRYKE